MAIGRTMDTVNYQTGFAAPNGTAQKSATKAAINSVQGTQGGSTPVKNAAYNAMNNSTEPVQQRTADPALTTMPGVSSNPGAAAGQAVQKTDPTQQALMNAMMQKMMQDQMKGQQATNKDSGQINTKQLDSRVVDELRKLHEGMKDYAKNMEKIIDKMKKEDPENKTYSKDLMVAMEGFAKDVRQFSDPDSEDFAPKKVNDSYKNLKETVDKEIEKNPKLKDDKNVKSFMSEAAKADKQATLMAGIGTGNNGTMVAVRDKMAEESTSSLKNISIPKEKLDGNEKLSSFDTAKKSLIEATDNLAKKSDPQSIEEFNNAFKQYKESFEGIKDDPKVDQSVKDGYQESLKSLDLLQESQNLLPKTSVNPDGSTSSDVKAEFESFNQDLYKHVEESTGGDKSAIRDFYDSIDVQPETPKATEEVPDIRTTQLDAESNFDESYAQADDIPLDSVSDEVEDILMDV